jgi:hypothetical protein
MTAKPPQARWRCSRNELSGKAGAVHREMDTRFWLDQSEAEIKDIVRYSLRKRKGLEAPTSARHVAHVAAGWTQSRTLPLVIERR